MRYNKRYAADFGEQYNNGTWEEGSFVTKDGTAFFARGRGQSPRGLRYRSHRPDYIVIDDLDDDELCENPARVSRLTDSVPWTAAAAASSWWATLFPKRRYWPTSAPLSP